VYLQYGESTTPYGFATIKGLSTSQPYDISLHLLVPTSASNIELGNFMASIVLSSMNNKTVIGSAQRSSLLVPPANPLRLLSPALTTIAIPLLDSFVPSYSSVRAKVEVGRPDGWRQRGNGEGRELAVVSAYVKGNVKLTGLMSIIAISPTLTKITTAVTFFFSSTLFALILYFAYSPNFTSLPPPKNEDVDVDFVTAPRRRRSLSRDSKGEPAERTLRRRRSRLSDSSPPRLASSKM